MRGGLARLVLGSVATDALRRTTLPLLLVRPSAMQPAQRGTAGERDATQDDVATAVSSARTPGPTVDVRLSAEDVALIERGLRALAYAPGYEYADILAARALATALHEATIASARTSTATP